MSLAAGVRLGVYEVVDLIGSGGMGEVYRARDPRLGRDVAIKVLPLAFSSDPERLARFEQEARAAAALNHPNILAVHDIGHHKDAPYIVSELLEGETLRDRLAGGALSARTAVNYAVQIAQGLAAAHDKGIVHRDLKPENLFVTTDGRVKILDFGLAKLTQTETTASPVTALPTTPLNTQAGVVLGTVGYMSPEQVRGRAADHRSDIFALGAILYEMLSGRRAFAGETAMDSMTAILKEEPPDLAQSERQIPPALQRVVDRCLQKAPAQRFQTASDLAFALDTLSSSSHSAIRDAQMAQRRHRLTREHVAWTSVAVLLVALVLLAIGYSSRQLPEPLPVRASIELGPEWSIGTGGPVAASGILALSPDGRRLAVAATRTDGQRLLLVRDVSAVTPQILSGSDGAHHPFWSPDSQSLGFFTEGKLKKIDLTNNRVVTLCDAPAVSRGVSFGATWNRHGVIVFAAGVPSTIYQVRETGGSATPLTTVSGKPKTGHLPFFLPDGQHFLYRTGGALAQGLDSTLLISSLDASDGKPLLERVSQAMYANGRLMFARGTTLMAQPFDTERLELIGEAAPLAEELAVGGGGNGVFSVSAQGSLVYRTGGAIRSQLIWYDRSGKPVGKIGELAQYAGLELSPDGTRFVVGVLDVSSGTRDLWVYDSMRGLPTRFTHTPESNEAFAVWSPDGNRIVFESNRSGARRLVQKTVDGGSSEETVFASPQGSAVRPASWSRDGRFLVYETNPAPVNADLWALPMFGDRKPNVLLESAFSEMRGRISPDNKWILYVSNESGGNAVYLATFPEMGSKRRISPEAGDWPRWRADGSEIFYLGATNVVMAAEVTRVGSRIEVTTVRDLFPIQAVRNVGIVANPFDVSSDGQRFLVNVVADELVPPITLVLNWPALLKQ